jgi:hypothetical protein
MLSFNDSNNKKSYNNDFKNSFKLEIKNKLNFNKEILLLISKNIL